MTAKDLRHLEAAPPEMGMANRSRDIRVYLVTTYEDGSTWHRTGYVGTTTGTEPGYLLLTRSNSGGSSDLLLETSWSNTVVAGLQNARGGPYLLKGRPVTPGRNRYVEATEGTAV